MTKQKKIERKPKAPAFAAKITIYVHPEDLAVMDEKAKARKQSRSQMIRDAVHCL